MRALSWGEEPTLRYWDLSGDATVTGPLHELDGHAGAVWRAEVNWERQHAISWSFMERSVRLWDLDRGEALRELKGPEHVTVWRGRVEVNWERHRALGWSHTDRELWLWDLEHGEVVHELSGHSGTVRCAAIGA
eukprot:gnl/TRDRNA2_/TRDRNA2_142301_c0_seq1.p4 gnl/TRDRNA2_/TRDRNA2_142301_c0~~gnl/TRDRNA2_/TRDRNA2_142301_c0_seq1.p4  ORF type:complete len:134 (+),score=21.74 gnl/TRDRNA2_/TRDRNA2_142301_c0_seq1:1168-1569(+)